MGECDTTPRAKQCRIDELREPSVTSIGRKEEVGTHGGYDRKNFEPAGDRRIARRSQRGNTASSVDGDTPERYVNIYNQPSSTRIRRSEVRQAGSPAMFECSAAQGICGLEGDARGRDDDRVGVGELVSRSGRRSSAPSVSVRRCDPPSATRLRDNDGMTVQWVSTWRKKKR